MKEKKMPRQIWAWSYTNKAGKAKVSLSMDREVALKVAVGDTFALSEIERHLRLLVEKEEAGE